MTYAARFLALLTFLCLGLTLEANASFVIEAVVDATNDNGPNTGSIQLKGTMDAVQVADANSATPELDQIRAMGIAIRIDLSGALAGSTFDIEASPLLIPGGSFQGPSSFSGVADGSVVQFAVADLSGSPRTFATALNGGNMLDLWQFDFTTLDGFDDGVDEAEIGLTVVAGTSPVFTTVDSIGRTGSAFTGNVYSIDFSNATGAITAVPEPSSFLFMGLLACLVYARRRWTVGHSS